MGLFGTGATDFFCDAVAAGSRTLQRALDAPALIGVVLAGLLALVLLGLSRATWRPSAPLRLARRRAWGQILAAAARMYGRRFRLFVGIGLLFLPISLLVTGLQALLLGASSVVGVQADGEGGEPLVFLVVAIGTTLTLLGVGLVQTATARALVELEDGRPVGPVRAYRMAFDCVRPLLGALVIAVFVVSLLASTLFLVPIAIWLAVRWALIAPVVQLEDGSAIAVLRQSGRLVRRQWLKVGSLTVVGGGIALALGPLLGALLIVLTTAPLSLLNIVAGVVYAVTMPFVALTTAYAYFDARVRDELEPERNPSELPAEIELPA